MFIQCLALHVRGMAYTDSFWMNDIGLLLALVASRSYFDCIICRVYLVFFHCSHVFIRCILNYLYSPFMS